MTRKTIGTSRTSPMVDCPMCRSIKSTRGCQPTKKCRRLIGHSSRRTFRSAQWLIDAVGQRRHTLLRVINAVVDEQRDYFDFGPESLKPLPMKTIADRLGIHVATVSRAVSEKYIMTPRGVVALRGFFSGGLATDSGEDVSSNSVKASIQDLVENEDKAKPLSDEKIVQALKERRHRNRSANGGEVSRSVGIADGTDAQAVLVKHLFRNDACH